MLEDAFDLLEDAFGLLVEDFVLPVEAFGLPDDAFGFETDESGLAPTPSEIREGNKLCQFNFPITAYWAIVNTLLMTK